MENSKESVLEYANTLKNGIQSKANKNKSFSTFLFFVVLISTVISPVLILISDNFYLSKVLPAFLTAAAALSSYWIQLRKPHERWIIYRTAQREIEHEISQYNFLIGEYSNGEIDKILADKVSKRALQLHYEWMPLVPKASELQNINNKSDEV